MHGAEHRRRSNARGAVRLSHLLFLSTIPIKLSCRLARYRIQRAGRIPGALKRFQRFPAHRGVDVQIRYSGHGAELLEHEEDHAVMQQAPVTPADEVTLLFAQTGGLE